MTNANAAIAAAKEYLEGRKLRRRLSELSSEGVGDRLGIGRYRAQKIRAGLTDTTVTHDVMQAARDMFSEAERIEPLVRQKSMNNLASKYHVSKVTIRRYAGLE